MKIFKNKFKKLTATAFASAFIICTLAACNAKDNGANAYALTKEQAGSIALLHSGVSENAGVTQNVSVESKDGGNYYRVEITCGNVTYVYRIDGNTGDIVKLSVNGETVGKDDLPAPPSDPDANYIGEAKAIEIALLHAKFTEADVYDLETDFDFDDGAYLYEVEFKHGKDEYEYEIFATDGEIYSLEINDFTVIVPVSANPSQTYISADRAKEIALADGNVSAENATFTKVKFEKDNGEHIYEIEFTAGGVEYEYEINAVSGTIIEREIDGEKRFPSSDTEHIGANAAIEIASAHSGVAINDMLKTEAKLKIKNGVYVYEVEFETKTFEYEYLIEAKTGKILSAEKEFND